jgi:hypothetical protein
MFSELAFNSLVSPLPKTQTKKTPSPSLPPQKRKKEVSLFTLAILSYWVLIRIIFLKLCSSPIFSYTNNPLGEHGYLVGKLLILFG